MEYPTCHLISRVYTVLTRGQRLFTFRPHVWRLFGGGSYSSKYDIPVEKIQVMCGILHGIALKNVS